MATDWSVVTVQHVEEACARHDAGRASPTHPARNTFLLLNGNRYPAKFIRGLAYEIATGSRPGDYQGGADTVAFFTSLGLTTDYAGSRPPPPPAAAKPPALEADPLPAVKPVSEKKAQKSALLSLLKARFGDVELEAKFGWLTVPAAGEMDEVLTRIHSALASHRGHNGFATVGCQLCCDYFIPQEKVLMEYDERQHFTVPRALALSLYPSDVTLHFDCRRWIMTCEKTKATDPTPPHRDEQRAFYDTLRDILADRNGYKLLRVMHGDFDWTSTNAADHLDTLLKGQSVTRELSSSCPTSSSAAVTDMDRQVVTKYLRMNPNRWWWEDIVGELLGQGNRHVVKVVGDRLRKTPPWKTKYRLPEFSTADIDQLVMFIRSEAATVEPSTAGAEATVVVAPETNYSPEVLKRLHNESEIQKLALVSHDYNRVTEAGLWDYSPHVKAINRACDEAGCDTILYALFTWDARSSIPRTHEALFDGLVNVRRIVMEIGDFSAHSDDPSFEDLWIETWLREPKAGPAVHRQRFATSQQAQSAAGSFISELNGRRLGTALLMICGETNVASLRRASGDMYDPHHINRRLRELNVRVILNPVHDYMKRYEMKEKRRYYSLEGRTVVSVWNLGKGSESSNPWTVFHDGVERTSVIQELPSPVPDRPDIRIGVVALSDLVGLSANSER